MKRTDFFKKVKIGENTEADFLTNSLRNFQLKRPYIPYVITEVDENRPDLVSYKFYNTVIYWWLICVVNNIEDPITEFTTGRLIKIPHILDIADFYREARQ